jgi:CRP/FNR family cyclic AMP-dependent transcriptional regulator
MEETLHVFGLEKTIVNFSAGDTIFDKNDEGDAMYIVKEGEVEIYIRDDFVVTRGKNGVFGEMALLDNSPRSAKVVAKTDCKLHAIREEDFLSHIRKTPFFAIQIMRILADRLREQTIS